MKEREEKKNEKRTDNQWAGKLVEGQSHVKVTPRQTESLTNLSFFSSISYDEFFLVSYLIS